MTALTIRLPESLHKSIKELARKEGISVNQFVASAAGEKMASLLTLDYLRNEAAAGKREDFERFLAAVPDVQAQDGDELSSDVKAKPRPASD
ncbi:MAG: toxin-antitoxin system HicB family antitoxin [Chromatiaceae bacterium]